VSKTFRALMDFTPKLNSLIARFETSLETLVPALPATPAGPARVHAAMRHSLQAGGKRIRPVLALAAAGLGARTPDESVQLVTDALPAAVALECVHTYSLIHDDLPCMDDDDLRRGRPTCHRAFDEATALLAGDALLAQAFVILATSYAGRPALAAPLVRVLADAASGLRLVGGQMQDLMAERPPGPGGLDGAATAADLEFIHLNKTAAMLEASLVCGGLVGGLAPAELDTLRRAGRELGLAFQIVDDVLDATTDTATLGKTAGKDARAGKATYVSLHGIATARRLATEHTESALASFRALPGDTGFLLELAKGMLVRRS
jgi:geranylgeranyl pyrophosphate synthase